MFVSGAARKENEIWTRLLKGWRKPYKTICQGLNQDQQQLAVTFQPGQPGSRVVFMTQRENMPRFNKNNEGPQINEIPQETGQTDWDKYR